MDAFSLPDDVATDFGESELYELTHRVRFPGCEHVVVRLLLLHYHPHARDVVARVPPVPPGIEITEIEPILQTVMNCGHRAGDLAGHEGFPADWTFVVEQNPIRGMHPVGFAVIHGDPIGIELRRRVGAARIEWRRLALRRFPD